MPAKNKLDPYYEKMLVLYEKIVATIPNVKRKGDTMPYTSHNGNMLSYLGKNGLVALRLPEGDREAFLKKYKTTLYAAYGIIQKEYVTVLYRCFLKRARSKSIFPLATIMCNR